MASATFLWYLYLPFTGLFRWVTMIVISGLSRLKCDSDRGPVQALEHCKCPDRHKFTVTF